MSRQVRSSGREEAGIEQTGGMVSGCGYVLVLVVGVAAREYSRELRSEN